MQLILYPFSFFKNLVRVRLYWGKDNPHPLFTTFYHHPHFPLLKFGSLVLTIYACLPSLCCPLSLSFIGCLACIFLFTFFPCLVYPFTNVYKCLSLFFNVWDVY